LAQRLPHLGTSFVQIFASLFIGALQFLAQLVSGYFQLALRFVLRLAAFFPGAILISPATA
jgi:hypothetical protein